MRKFLFASIALALAATCAAQAPAPPQPPKQIHGQGCVEAGVEASCLVVKDTGSGTLYNLLIKGDKPRVGAGIEFTGTPFEGMTICMQGAPVRVSHWEKKDSLKCPASEKPQQ